MASTLYNAINENEERFILSRRRAVIFIIFMGLVVLSLIFLIRMDVDIKHSSMIGERASVVEKITPVLPGPVTMAVNGDAAAILNGGEAARMTIQNNQRDPRLLLAALFGSLYNRTDFLPNKN